jgi:hypothetical protein
MLRTTWARCSVIAIRRAFATASAIPTGADVIVDGFKPREIENSVNSMRIDAVGMAIDTSLPNS